ncbi:hypothetical protein [Streptomyces sp. NPDC002044]|uniref:hypothetical protein n=1 Tax=Streptomyces sp. NPDC002044 TaxID=3154662 RepID=UPI003330D9FC
MDFVLHGETDVTVTAVRPWGLEVESPDGSRGFIDQAKTPVWPSAADDSLVGAVLHVIVLDETRDPVRLSTLDTDVQIGRRLRAAAGG